CPTSSSRSSARSRAQRPQYLIATKTKTTMRRAFVIWGTLMVGWTAFLFARLALSDSQRLEESLKMSCSHSRNAHCEQIFRSTNSIWTYFLENHQDQWPLLAIPAILALVAIVAVLWMTRKPSQTVKL